MTPFITQHRIFYHHTDSGGIVYYATYLHLLEEARTEFLLSKKISVKDHLDLGISFPVVHVSVDYRSPAKYGDTLQVSTAIEKIGRSSMVFMQDIHRQDQLLVHAKIIWACVGPDFKTIVVPEKIRKEFA